jgi:hypothetical protein
MRIGNIEGTPQEIKDLCENHGLNLEDYLEKPESTLNIVWLIIPSCTLMASIILEAFYQKYILIWFLIGGGSLTWLGGGTYVKFKNPWTTGVVVIGGLMLLLVAGGFILPEEVPKILKGLKPSE